MVEEIVKQIDEDEDVAVLVLDAPPGNRRAGRSCPRWRSAPPPATSIPITIVPGDLAVEDIKALA
jgi:hypothetical protein